MWKLTSMMIHKKLSFMVWRSWEALPSHPHVYWRRQNKSWGRVRRLLRFYRFYQRIQTHTHTRNFHFNFNTCLQKMSKKENKRKPLSGYKPKRLQTFIPMLKNVIRDYCACFGFNAGCLFNLTTHTHTFNILSKSITDINLCNPDYFWDKMLWA